MIYFPFSLSMSHNFELGCVTVTFPHTLRGGGGGGRGGGGGGRLSGAGAA
jgi:hypothetical protein